jgi:hypothetical protein
MRANMEVAQRELTSAQVRIKELETEVNELYATNETMGNLLRLTANGLKGEPDPRMLHSWHDLPLWASRARAVVTLYLAATAPNATHESQGDFIQALNAWRDMTGRDLFETALAFQQMDGGAGQEARGAS